MRKKKILFIISEIIEALSLSNKPHQLLDTTLDTLMNTKNIHSCWIQLLLPERNKLQLTAHRNFSKMMTKEINQMNSMNGIDGHVFGLGNSIHISDLANDTKFGLISFKEAGLLSVVMVPLRTYHTRGILGVASCVRDVFDKDFVDVLLLIGNLICAALDKADLYQRLEERVYEFERVLKYEANENNRAITADREFEEVMSDPETAMSIKDLKDLAVLAEEYHRRAHSAIKDAIVEAKEINKISNRLNKASPEGIKTSECDNADRDYEDKDEIKAVIAYLESSLREDVTHSTMHQNKVQTKESVSKDGLSHSVKTFEIHKHRMNAFRTVH